MQQDRILKNYVLRFPEFRELTVFDAGGRPVATSRIGAPTVAVPGEDAAELYGVRMSPVFVDDDLLPTALVAAPIGRAGRRRRAGSSASSASRNSGGWSIASASAHPGTRMVVGPRGDLLAHGNPEERSRVARGESLGVRPGGGCAAIGRARNAAGARAPRRERRADAGGGRPRAGARLDGARRTADARGVRRGAPSRTRSHRRHQPGAARDAARGPGLGPFAHPADPRAHPRHRGDRRRPPRRARPHQVEVGTRPPRRRVQHAWRTASASSRKTSGSRSATRCSAAWPPASSTTCRTRSRTSRTTAGSSSRCTTTRSTGSCSGARSTASSRTIKRVFEDLRNIARPMPMEHFPLDLNRLAARRGRVDARQRRGRGPDHRGGTRDRARSTSRATCSRSAASAATWCMNAIEATAAARARDHRHRRRRRARAAARRGHGLRHPAGAHRDDVRRLQHDEAPGPGPGPGDYEEDRGSVGRDDHARRARWARAPRSWCRCAQIRRAGGRSSAARQAE